MDEEKYPYIKITSLAEFKHDNLEEEWYVIAPSLEEAKQIADRIGMPENRKVQRVFLTEKQYESIPEAY